MTPRIPFRNMVSDERFYQALDPGIRFAVRVLQAHLIETCQSCQGGPGHSYPEPTVDLLGAPATANGFLALASLAAYGLPVRTVSYVWMIEHGLPFECFWRITLSREVPERADECPSPIHYRFGPLRRAVRQATA